MLLNALREKTRPYHQKIEKNVLLSKLMGPLTLSDYIETLKKFYGFYVPLETIAIPRFLDQHSDFHKFYFPKLALLKKDLDILEPAGIAPKLCPSPPNPDSSFGWLGVLYVLEGSCLGRTAMWPHIQQQLNLDSGGSFFGNASNDLKTHWSAFCKSMTEKVQTPSQEQEVISGAIATFVALDEWFAQ